jgi:hypothetical protein
VVLVVQVQVEEGQVGVMEGLMAHVGHSDGIQEYDEA